MASAQGQTWTWSQVHARRLARHALDAAAGGTGPAAVAGIASRMAGVHAQVLSAAEIGIAMRLDGATRTDVQRALWTDRSLVKTFGPRGTVHLLATRDLPAWTAALSALPVAPSPHPDGVRLTPEQAGAVIAAIGDALRGAELTIDELTEAVVARTGPWAGDLVMPAFQTYWPRWRQVLHLAGMRGALCFGPNRGRKVTYTSPDHHLRSGTATHNTANGNASHQNTATQNTAAHNAATQRATTQRSITQRSITADATTPDATTPDATDPGAALAWLVRSYLNAYGPATPRAFAHWLNAPAPWAADLFASLGDALTPVDIEGVPAWAATGDAAPPVNAPTGVRLLPYFDTYAYRVGNLPPAHLSTPAAAAAMKANHQLLVVDGRVAGRWHQARTGRRVAVTVDPATPLTPAQRADLDRQAIRLSEILDAPTTLTLGPVTTGGHA